MASLNQLDTYMRLLHPHGYPSACFVLQPIGGAIRSLIMAPTRELAAQTKAEAVKLLQPHGANAGVQVSMHVQKSGGTLFVQFASVLLLAACLSTSVCNCQVFNCRYMYLHVIPSCSSIYTCLCHWRLRAMHLSFVVTACHAVVRD